MAKLHLDLIYQKDYAVRVCQRTGIAIKFTTQNELLLLLKNNIRQADLCKFCIISLFNFFKSPTDEFTEFIRSY